MFPRKKNEKGEAYLLDAHFSKWLFTRKDHNNLKISFFNSAEAFDSHRTPE
jgi:hypothetical protein